MNKHTLEAALTAGAKELKNQKAAKAKRIVMAADGHLRSYQAEAFPDVVKTVTIGRRSRKA